MAAARSHRYVRALGGIVAMLTLLALAATPAFAQNNRGPSKQVRKPLEKLWSEYPLDPFATRTVPPANREPAQTGTTPAGTPVRASEPSPAEDDGAPVGWIVLFGATAAAMLAAAAVWVLRPGLVHVPTLKLPVRPPRPRHRGRFSDLRRMPQRREGGIPMYQFVRRLLGKDDENREGAGGERAASGAEPGSIDHAIFTPYFVQSRSDAVSSEADKPAESSDREAAADGNEAVAAGGEAHVGDGGDYTQLGEHVAAVLTSAREAADELLAAARADAERIRTDADERAKQMVSAAGLEADGMRGDAARIRSEAEAYSDERRASAEAHAEAARRVAEDERAKQLADAEQGAHAIRAEAERRVREIASEAVQRHEALVRDIGRSEERVEELLTVFRAMTSQLEAVVKAEADIEPPADVEAPVGEALDDALTPERATRRDERTDVVAGGPASR
jgi:hypothetical protein